MNCVVAWPSRLETVLGSKPSSTMCPVGVAHRYRLTTLADEQADIEQVVAEVDAAVRADRTPRDLRWSGVLGHVDQRG